MIDLSHDNSGKDPDASRTWRDVGDQIAERQRRRSSA